MAEVEIPDPDELKEQGASRFTKMVALSTAVIAVGLAVASVGGSNAGKDMMKEQIEASNQWARYQAKSIRERMAEQEIRRLQIEIAAAEGDPAKAKVTGLLQKELEYYGAERNRYKKDKDEIEALARNATAASLTNQRKDGYFDVVMAGERHRKELLTYLDRRAAGETARLALPCRRAREVIIERCAALHVDDERVDTCELGQISIRIEPAAIAVLV